MIDKATVQRILDAADIVEVVSDYVHLVKRGSNYMGLCPFHNEKTPSFSVSRSRNICHCFSCGKGGSPVNFIMEKEGINYHDALLHLADKYGIKVEERQLSDEERARQNEREAMLTANDWAMRKMMSNLTDTEEGRDVGLSYLFQRGVTMEAVKAFRLGYAIDRGDSLVNAAKAEGYDFDILCKVGLCGVSQNGGRPYDRFRGRVIFPVLNTAGKVIAFGGRGIKGEPAKYINSPESALYRKSNELYGIYQARNAIVNEKRCFLVEGYMDVIGMWQSGMKNVVASSGTSLTDGQIALLHRFTNNVTLIYDGDAAGIKASLRGIDLLLSQKLNINILLLPDGDDPDSFARKHTPEEFRKYVDENQKDFIDFEIGILTSENDSPQTRAAAVASIVRSVASVVDPIQRQLYIQKCALRLNLSESLLLAEVKKARIQVVDDLRKRRDLERITRQREQREQENSAAPLQTTTPTEAAADDPAVAQETPTRQSTLQTATDIRNAKIVSLERNILAYCVKYGLMTFCQSTEDDENPRWLNVIEYVSEEMKADGIEFSAPLSRKIFGTVSALCDEYRREESAFLEEVDREQEERVKEWYKEMAASFSSAADIESKEQELRADLDSERYEKARRFAMDYSAKVLGSHQDDAVRHFALDVITPRYKLSTYHAKATKIVLEEDRIDELIPRAISEWKDGLLEARFRTTQKSLREASEKGDAETIMKCMAQLQEISALRRQVAKTIGERIVAPRSSGK